MKKWFSYIASCLPLLAVFFLLSSNTAFAQTASSKVALNGGYCHYNDSTCTGQDPVYTLAPSGQYMCVYDGRVLQTVNIPGGQVQLYWSANCGTNWTVTINGSGNYYIMNANATRASDGLRLDGTWYSTNYVYSPMVFAPTTPVQGCGSINNWPGGCTNWF